MVKRTRRNIGVVMEKLSKRALGCMYTAAIIGAMIGVGILVAINVLWFIPDEIERATYKQIRCANFICRELGINFEPILKTKTWEFINTYLDVAKQNNKQRRDNNFRDWCEDNLDWLPEYF